MSLNPNPDYDKGYDAGYEQARRDIKANWDTLRRTYTKNYSSESILPVVDMAMKSILETPDDETTKT